MSHLVTRGEPRFCPEGHRIIFSTGECTTVIEIRGRYRYFAAPCLRLMKLIRIARSLDRAAGAITAAAR